MWQGSGGVGGPSRCGWGKGTASGPGALPSGVEKAQVCGVETGSGLRRPGSEVTGFGFSFRGHVGWRFLKGINIWVRFNQGQRNYEAEAGIRGDVSLEVQVPYIYSHYLCRAPRNLLRKWPL